MVCLQSVVDFWQLSSQVCPIESDNKVLNSLVAVTDFGQAEQDANY